MQIQDIRERDATNIAPITRSREAGTTESVNRLGGACSISVQGWLRLFGRQRTHGRRRLD